MLCSLLQGRDIEYKRTKILDFVLITVSIDSEVDYGKDNLSYDIYTYTLVYMPVIFKQI